jgi:hypothetical protein
MISCAVASDGRTIAGDTAVRVHFLELVEATKQRCNRRYKNPAPEPFGQCLIRNPMAYAQGIKPSDNPQGGERACALSSWALASHSTKSARGWTADKKAHV